MTKGEQARLTAWRLRLLQAAGDSGNISRTCRHFGISRQTFYKWARRYQAHEAAGLSERPHRPLRSPHETGPAVVSKILYLREQYHFGPGKITDYLKRFHQIAVARSTVGATVTSWNI